MTVKSHELLPFHGDGDRFMDAKRKTCNAKDGSCDAGADVVRWCGD